MARAAEVTGLVSQRQMGVAAEAQMHSSFLQMSGMKGCFSVVNYLKSPAFRLRIGIGVLKLVKSMPSVQ